MSARTWARHGSVSTTAASTPSTALARQPAGLPEPAAGWPTSSALVSAQLAKSRAERLAAPQNRLEQVAVPLHTLQRFPPAEVARTHLLAELLPVKRHGHGRARLRPHVVGGRDRLPVSVLAVVDQDAAALLLQPFGGHQAGIATLEVARNSLGELVGVGVRRAPRDRHEHVDAIGAARLRVRANAESFERLANQVRHPDCLCEAVA